MDKTAQNRPQGAQTGTENRTAVKTPCAHETCTNGNNTTDYIPRLYGCRRTRPSKPHRARLLRTLLPEVSLPVPVHGRLNPASSFPRSREIWLEIGFGGGEHLAWQARRNPDTGIIGAEPFTDGVGKLLAAIESGGLENVRIHAGDARPLLQALPGASLTRIFVLYPDPWPKKRHHKRRIVNAWFFRETARVLSPGGLLHIESDIPAYIDWIREHAAKAPAFRQVTGQNDTPEPDTPASGGFSGTRYGRKALREGRRPVRLFFRKHLSGGQTGGHTPCPA